MWGGGGYTVHVVKLSAREDEDNVLFSAHLFFLFSPHVVVKMFPSATVFVSPSRNGRVDVFIFHGAVR